MAFFSLSFFHLLQLSEVLLGRSVPLESNCFPLRGNVAGIGARGSFRGVVACCKTDSEQNGEFSPQVDEGQEGSKAASSSALPADPKGEEAARGPGSSGDELGGWPPEQGLATESMSPWTEQTPASSPGRRGRFTIIRGKVTVSGAIPGPVTSFRICPFTTRLTG